MVVVCAWGRGIQEVIGTFLSCVVYSYVVYRGLLSKKKPNKMVLVLDNLLLCFCECLNWKFFFDISFFWGGSVSGLALGDGSGGDS